MLDIAFSGSTAHTHTHRPYRGRGGAGLEPLRAGGVQRRQHGSPWFDPRVAMQDFALHLVGTVPNLPLPLSTTDPASVASALGIGHEAQVQTDLAAGWNCWGAGCSDFSIKQCASSADCSAGYLNLQGVCMHMDFETSSTSTPLWTPLKPPFKCHGATRAASTPTIRTRPRPESTCQTGSLATGCAWTVLQQELVIMKPQPQRASCTGAINASTNGLPLARLSGDQPPARSHSFLPSSLPCATGTTST